MNDKTTTWPDLAIGLYDKLNERNAEIEYEFDSMDVSVPRNANDEGPEARWRLDGTIRVRTRNVESQ